MRDTTGPVDGTGAGIIGRFGIDEGLVPRTVAFDHLAEVFDAAKDVLPPVVRVDVERGRRSRHELGDADGADTGNGRIVEMAFCRKDSRDQDRVDVIHIGCIADILGDSRRFAAADIFADLVVDHFFLCNGLDRRQGHNSQQKGRHFCLTGFAKYQLSHSSPLTTILYLLL